MDLENKTEDLIGANYKEVKINKIIIDGKEQAGNIISAEDTKDKHELSVAVFTEESKTGETKGGGAQQAL
ncbi:hypothetical protein AALB39_21550 [Lachnospiraceae bacterium 54-53]